MTDNDTQDGTLGARLDQAARRIAARHLITCAWSGGLAPMLARTARLTEPFQGRFERDESPAGRKAEDDAVHGVMGHGLARAAPPAAAPPSAAAQAVGPQAMAPQDRGPRAGAAADTGRPLPFDVRAQLRAVAGPGADALRVHDDSAADTLAQAHRADAVATGIDVYLRDGLFRPDEPAGFALLAHEATHVTALVEQGGVSRRGAAGGIGAEEEAALAREQAARELFGHTGHEAMPASPTAAARLPAGPVMHPAVPTDLLWPPGAPGPAGPGGPPGPAGAPPAAAAAAARPMAAPVDRDLPQQAPFDAEELRRNLINDLMRQLRTEFERGG